MKLNIEYGFADKDNPQKLSNQEVTYNFLTAAVNQKYPQGLPADQRSMWGKMQRKIEKAVDEKGEEVNLNDSEMDFIKRCFKEAKYTAQSSKFVNMLEEEIEKFYYKTDDK